MTRARLLALGLLLALFAPVASGCELVADFDRGKIPKPATDGGSPGALDGSFVPPPPTIDAGAMPAPDAGPSAIDAGAPVGDGAVLPPPPDAG